MAVFAVGIFWAYRHRFQAIQLAGGRDEAVIVLSDENVIRDFNQSADELFPEKLTRDAIGRSLSEVLPSISNAMDADTTVIEIERDDVRRFYRLTDNPFGAGQTRLGGLLTLTDITHREQYRQELERQNERLEQFADMISHDLRNPLIVAEGHLDMARDEFQSDDLESVATALDRMKELIDDVLALARQGQPIDAPEPVSLSSTLERCRGVIETGEAVIESDGDLEFMADPERLQQLLENLIRNAIDHGPSDVRIRVGPLATGNGFFVSDDGPGIPEDDRRHVFESGYTTDDAGTGFGLAIVKEIVDAHGWSIDIQRSEAGGARFEISGVSTT